MLYRNLELLDVGPIHSVIKVDDTISGIREGFAAGCWTVGVARYSNYMDMDSMEQAEAMSEQEIQVRLQKTRQILKDSGAHYVVDSITDLPGVIEQINERLKKGECPNGTSR
ncbi:MAG: hypothetical protein COB67_12360 [SAR324 cluster bacterium]|uniref:Phosphonoacetaldehyde hydrolase n=1 Tax=SAR324 cluster bacterium TaxID=2024889 RepID=A0A2A4SR88_9DELT|nr:MAG: hypothetical protein COB67_12360 [SAR324 cluster bacterium]